MNKEYIILEIKNLKQNILIEAIKVDNNLNKINEFKKNIKENDVDISQEFIDFCKNSKVITKNSKVVLSILLKLLYKNNITCDFRFKYIDVNDLNININNNNELLELVNNYLINNNISNLNDLFLSWQFKGKIFRGLNYAKYLCDVIVNDNKYYGYIIDNSSDKYVSYYSVLKELKGEYFSLEEINNLKNNNARVIMNISYLCDESLTFTDYYSVQAVENNKVTSDCNKLIKGINNFLNNEEYQKNIKLILWGDIDNFYNQYEILDKEILDKLKEKFKIIKKPWDYFTNYEISILDK